MNNLYVDSVFRLINKKESRLRDSTRRARVALATIFFSRECASLAERFLLYRKFGGISYKVKKGHEDFSWPEYFFIQFLVLSGSGDFLAWKEEWENKRNDWNYAKHDWKLCEVAHCCCKYAGHKNECGCTDKAYDGCYNAVGSCKLITSEDGDNHWREEVADTTDEDS